MNGFNTIRMNALRSSRANIETISLSFAEDARATADSDLAASLRTIVVMLDKACRCVDFATEYDFTT